MKLNELISLAIERFDKQFSSTDKDQTAWLFLRKAYLDFLKTELETIVKESFKNTRVEEKNKTNARALSLEWLIDGYNQALSDKHNKENQFLNN